MKVRLVFGSTRWWPARGPEVRLARLRQVLLSAQRTRRYRPALERAGLSSARAIARLSSIEEALDKLPYMDWAEFQGSPSDFYNPAAPSPAPRRLRFPTRREIRTAVLGPRLTESSAVRVFGSGWLEEVRQFSPEALAAPVDLLLQMADSARSGTTVPKLTRAIVAFTGLEHGALSSADRQSLWQTFEVPVFEQCLGPDGSLLAFECEAHEGLHMVEENAIVERRASLELVLTSLTGHRHPAIRVVSTLTAGIEDEICGCGLPGPRLVGLMKRASDSARYQYCQA